MTTNTIMEQLIEQLKTEFSVTDALEPNTMLDGILDSLDIINLMFFIETDLGVKISDDLIDEGDILILENLAKHIADNQS